MVFDAVHLVKPLTSRVANSELGVDGGELVVVLRVDDIVVRRAVRVDATGLAQPSASTCEPLVVVNKVVPKYLKGLETTSNFCLVQGTFRPKV